MQLNIRYAKEESNGKPSLISGYEYDINTDISDKNQLVEIVGSIMASYGNYALDHYIERDADFFTCYIDNEIEPVYVSDKAFKMDPISIVDGMIRRSNVSSIVLKYDKLIYILEEPEPDATNINNVIISQYKIVIPDEDGKKNTVSAENITIFFPYRDGKHSTIPNKKCADNTIPFFYLINGIVHDELINPEYYGYDEFTQEYVNEPEYTVVTDTEIRNLKIRVIPYDDSIIYVTSGEYEENSKNDLYPDGEIQNIFEGLFFSMNESCAVKDRNLLNIYSWMSANKQSTFVDTMGGNIRINTASIEETIISGEYQSLFSSKTMDQDLKNCMNEALSESGFALSAEFISEPEINTSETIHHLSMEQSQTMFDIFSYTDDGSRKYKCSLKNVFKIIKNTLENFPKITLDKNSIMEDDFKTIINEIISSVRSCEHSQSFRENEFETAIHETGHAVVGNMLAPEHQGLWEKITIIPDTVANAGGYCAYNDDNYKKLIDSVEKKIMINLGGMLAEELCLGDNSSGWSQDYRDCKGAINELLISDETEFAFDKNEKKIRFIIDGSTYPTNDIHDLILSKIIKQTRELLKDKKEQINELAGRLVKEKEIDGNTFDMWFKEVCG